MTLSPAFDPAVTSYSATTYNATNKVTATASDSGDTVEIKKGSTTVTNGTSVAWAEGENILTITVSDGTDSTIYTVTVTRLVEEATLD